MYDMNTEQMKNEVDGKKSKKLKMRREGGENSREMRTTKDTITWPDSDILELISNIQKKIPSEDSVSYNRRIEEINWANITFKKYTVKECKKVWLTLLQQVRKFRTLQEIVTDMKSVVESPKRASSKNFLRHPEKPKQPLNSYMLFVKKKRQKVMNQNPDLSPTEVSRKLGMMFRDLPIKAKEKYDQKARVAREEYVEKMKTFYREHPDHIPRKRSKAKALQYEDENGPPSKPKTPFQLFVKVESEKPNSEEHQNYREIWNEMTDKEKFFWINWAQEQYQEYNKRLKNYLKIHPEYDPGQIKILSKKEKEIRDRQLGMPEKPPRTAYHLFTKMIMEAEDMRKMNSRDAVVYISEKWKACPDDEKNEYKTRIEQMWDEYHIKLEEYRMSLPPEERFKVKVTNIKKCKVNNKRKTTKIKKKLPKPVRPPLTEYLYFLSTYKEKANPLVVWESMTDEVKQKYRQEFAELQKNYIKLYEAYLRSLSKEELEKFSASNHNIDDSTDSESE